MILLRLLLISSFLVCSHQLILPWMNDEVQRLFKEYGINSEKVHFVGNNPQMQLNSKLEIHEEFGVPDRHMWSRCQFCSFQDGRCVLYNNSFQTKFQNLKISESLWHEFFHSFQNDQYYARSQEDISVNARSAPKYLIKSPIYIIPMITFHPGHLLIDVLEIVFYSMHKHYGEIRKDAILIFDVAPRVERGQILEKIEFNIQKENEMLGSLLHAITSQPIVTYHFFEKLIALPGVVFESIHILPNTILSSYYIGYRFHPYDLSSLQSTTFFDTLSQRYEAFGEYMLSALPSLYPNMTLPIATKRYDRLSSAPAPAATTTDTVDILIVQRHDNRVILNLDVIVEYLRYTSYTWKVVNLAKLPISDQLQLFQHVKIVIAAAGTTFHNVIFMPRVIALVILMQPGWCDWSWMYVNQPLLLRVKPFIYCSTVTEEVFDEYYIHSPVASEQQQHSSTRLESFMLEAYAMFPYTQWSRKSVEQGPRLFKTMNLTVDTSMIYTVLDETFAYVHAKQTWTTPFQPLKSILLAMKAAAETAPIQKSNNSFPVYTFPPTLAQLQHDLLLPRELAATSSSSSSSSLSSPVASNLFRIVISSMKVTPIEYAADGHERIAWELRLDGDFFGHEEIRNMILQTVPHLAICMNVLTIEKSSPWCIAYQELNYYATLKMTIDYPIHILHFWVQLSMDGGKIEGTDAYMPVDIRLPEVGWYVHRHFQKEMITMMLDLSDLQKVFPAGILGQDPQKAIPLRLFLNYLNEQRFSIQLYIPSFCVKMAYSHHLCAVLTWKMYRYLHFLVINEAKQLPKVQSIPSPTNPFVFLHVEKTGGTTIRAALAPSADILGLEYFIPCYDGMSCLIFRLPTFTPRSVADVPMIQTLKRYSRYNKNPENTRPLTYGLSILSGHFYWDIWHELPQCQIAPTDATIHQPPPCEPSVFIMGRDPIARVMSYYHQRLYLEETSGFYQKRINSFTKEEWESVVIHQRFARYLDKANTTIMIVDEGMNDASCRAILNLKTTSGVTLDEMESEIPPAITAEQTQLAIARVRKSVVGVLERWDDTLLAVKHWFPWIQMNEIEGEKLNNNNRKESAKDLRHELLQVIRDNNQCDLQVYQEMNRLLDLQLESIRGTGFQLPDP